MIRKLLLPLVAVALLGGCVTSGYSYRQGSGDYYYGAPSVEYRYHPYYGGPYGYGYPYGAYGHGYYGRSVYDYRYDWPYRYRHYYDPRAYYYGYPYRQPSHTYRRTAPRPTVDPTPDRTRSPWRDLERLRRRGAGDGIDPAQSRNLAPQPEGLRDGGAALDRERPLRRALDRSRGPGGTEGLMQRTITTPQMPSQTYSRPEPRGDGSALGGMVRRSQNTDPADETTP